MVIIPGNTSLSGEWLFVRENNRIFVVLRASEGSRRTYGKCFRIVLLRKCGSFQKRRDRRTNTHFLFSIWTGSALGVPLLPHIYTGVGYCIVYFRLGSTTTFLEVNEIDSTLSFFYPITAEESIRSVSPMTQKEEVLQRAVEQALKDCDSFYERGRKLNVSKVSDIQIEPQTYNPSGIDESMLERCTGGEYNGSCRLETKDTNGNRIEQIYTITVSFQVTNYNPKVNQFTVKITNVTVNERNYLS